MRHAFGKSAHGDTWDSTNRTADQLLDEAMREVKEAIGGETNSKPGAASLELAVRAAYPLVVSGRLNADRGSNSNEQPDRRTPGEVLDAMRHTTQGVLQLVQALRDFAANQPIRAVDETGQVKRLSDNSGEQVISDVYLRGEYPPKGKARAHRPGDTPGECYQNRLGEFSQAIERLKQAFAAVTEVLGDDGRPLADSIGVDRRDCETWRDDLSKIDEELVVWRATFKRAYGTVSEPSSRQFLQDEDGAAEEIDVYADAYPDEDEVNRDNAI
jgi:predicted RNase H-like HicB family nuclease